MASFVQYLILGLGVGGIYALLAEGMVVIYAGSGVLNIAHGAMAMLGAYIFYDLRFEGYTHHWGFWPALGVTVGALALLGALVQQVIMRPLRNASSLAKVVATLGLLIMIQGAAALIWGTDPRFVPADLPHKTYFVSSVAIPEDRLYMAGIAVLLTAALWSVYRFTRTGLAIRAGSMNARAAATLGWSADRLATVTWALGAALAGVAGVLIVPIIGLAPDQLPLVVVPVLAAALLGSFTSLWLTLVGALAIGIGEAEVTQYVHQQGAQWSLPFLVIVLLLAVSGKTIPVRGFSAERLPKVGTGHVRWPVVVPVVVLTAYLMFDVFSASLLDALIQSLSWGLLMLSVVVLLGFTSQLSFEQMAMAGLTAVIAGRLVEAAHFPFVVAALVGMLAAIPIGVLFALPALRTRGINLAVVTLGLGAVVANMILTNVQFIVTQAGIPVPPATLFGIPIDGIKHANRYAVVVLFTFVLGSLAVANIRRGKSGSALIAVRTNERAAAALGINVLTTKLFAFVVGSSLAAAGGILIAFRGELVTFDEFLPFNSILTVSYAVIGGVGSVIGPLGGMPLVIGGVGAWVLRQFYPGAASAPLWLTLLAGVAVVKFLIVAPDGIILLKARLFVSLGRRLARVLHIPLRPVRPEPIPEVAGHKAAPTTLEIEDLVVRFGGVTAVDGASLTVRPGEVLGLIGPNGAGKTTVIDAVVGFVKPARGVFKLNGEPIGSWPVHQRVRAGLSRSFQGLELFESSTVRENLRVASDRRDFLSYFVDIVRPGHRPLSAAAAAAIREFELADVLDVTVSDLPFGRRRLVAIARAIAVDPSVLLLDEPAAGLSGAETAELVAVVRRLAREWQFAVLVIEHDMSFVMDVCDRIVVLDFGRQIAEGTPDEIRTDPAVVAAYLGAPLELPEAAVGALQV